MRPASRSSLRAARPKRRSGAGPLRAGPVAPGHGSCRPPPWRRGLALPARGAAPPPADPRRRARAPAPAPPRPATKGEAPAPGPGAPGGATRPHRPRDHLTRERRPGQAGGEGGRGLTRPSTLVRWLGRWLRARRAEIIRLRSDHFPTSAGFSTRSGLTLRTVRVEVIQLGIGRSAVRRLPIRRTT